MSRFIEVLRPNGTSVYVDKLAISAVSVTQSEQDQWQVYVHTGRSVFAQHYSNKAAALAGQQEIVAELEVPE